MAASLIAATPPQDDSRARELLRNGRPGEAAAIYRALSAADPAKAEWLLNLSIALYQAKDFRGAAESARRTLDLNPSMLPASLFLGASYLELGEFEKAVPLLERVVAGNPGDRNGRLMLAKALLAGRQFERAAQEFEAASQLLPQNPSVWYGLGRAREALGRKEAANAAWVRLAAFPDSFEAHMHAAERNDAAERWLEASQDWEQALRLVPESATARSGLAGSLFRRRDYMRVLSTLEPLLTTSSAEASFLYGASLVNLQRAEEAIPHLERALSRDPNFLPAAAALGQALLQTSRPRDAILYLTKAAATDTDGSVHFQLFRAYQSTNAPERAQEALADYKRLRGSGSRNH